MTTERQPLVSVVIPVFNGESCIARAIQSALDQGCADLEVVVVDDGSTDRTSEIVRRFGKSVIYKYQHNQERSVARNTGIELTRGRYIAFLDADDWWLPGKLERQIAHAERHSNLGIVYSWVSVVNEDGKLLRLLGNERPSCETTGVDLFEWFLLGHSVPTPSVIIRRECLDVVGCFDETITYIEDWDLWMRIASRYSIGHVTEPLACYQVHHSYLPAVFARHELQTKRLYVIEKALAARPAIGPEVRAHAMLRALWYSALIDFGVKDVSAAQSWIEQIVRQTPDLSARAGELETYLVGFAFSLYADFTPENEARTFVELVLESLPSKLAFLKRRGRQVQGKLLEGYAFVARAQGDSSRAKTLMRRAMLMNPRSAFNVGALTTGLTGSWLDRVRRPNESL